MSATIVVPTFNEGGNVEELVTRLAEVVPPDTEVLFVDDSTDTTPEIICKLIERAPLPVRLLHRESPEGGLAGAVVLGIANARGERVLVMDGDLQHPPELVPTMLDGLNDEDGVELVVASRYVDGGDAGGLSSLGRRWVSSSSTVLAQACFPKRVGRVCSDPMTGFFAFRRDAVDLDRLRPRGFKILLEILARHDLEVREVPFTFGERFAGESKADWRNGLTFIYQLASLRMGRMSRFAVVGALGTVVNLLVMALLLAGGVHYLPAAIVAAEISILHNFLMQERFVYRDLRTDSRAGWGKRAALFFGFNNIEALARIPVLAVLVSGVGLHPIPAQALTLAVAFLLRFVFVSRVVYRPRRAPAELTVHDRVEDYR
jgi:dolichol-phosphate mannosyltransferase